MFLNEHLNRLLRNRKYLISATLFLAACSGPNVGRNVRVGQAAYDAVPPSSAIASYNEYIVGPLDSVDITVFQEPDISVKALQVDAQGNIVMPLIGQVHASGRTAIQLAHELEQRLGERFYTNPQVTVSVSSSVSQRVTVQGEVTEAGIYEIKGPTTLLDAIALAKGESENSALKQVLILRTINGQRTAAVFDVERIRRGDDPDPAVTGRDVVIVGHSNSKQIWHDVLKSAPLLNVFTRF